MNGSERSGADNRRVALIKSLATNNRFYTLVSPERGIRNADAIQEVPDDLLLGIAYPCLEDGLNDFAVIRTTYETLDLFPEDDEMRGELLEIINDARGNLLRRMWELTERFQSYKAHFLGTDLKALQTYLISLAQRGCPRRNLDNMMKVNVFASVAEAEGEVDGEPFYKYEFYYKEDLERHVALTPHDFLIALFADVIDGVIDDDNYANKYAFDKNIFQKYIALMFANYAATNPIFYGTNKEDYGVSNDKDMDNTPLYLSIAREMRRIEKQPERAWETPLRDEVAATVAEGAVEQLCGSSIELPDTLVHEEALLGPLSSICAAAQQLSRSMDPDNATEFASLILSNASRLVRELKRLNLVSPFAYDPGEAALEDLKNTVNDASARSSE